MEEINYNMGYAIGYIRISSKDQSRYSIDNQERCIRDYCRRYDLGLIALFKDNGQASDTFERADFIALEEFIKRHKGRAQYLVIMEHDRFSRDLSEALQKIKEFEKRHRIKVLSEDEPLDLDTSDPDVFMRRAFKYLQANVELLNIRKRTRRGIQFARESGRFINMAPFGYKNDRDQSGKGIIVIDPSKSFIIQKIFNSYLAGMPFHIIHKEVAKLGFTRSGKNVIPYVLNNEVYAGYIKIPGKGKTPERLIDGIHEPIISKSVFWMAQSMLQNKRPSKSQPAEDFPLRGILKCWCGRHMTAGWTKGKSKYYLYYRCTKHVEKNISGPWLHQQVEDTLSLLSLKPDQVQYIIKATESKLKESLAYRERESQAKVKYMREIDSNIEKLEQRFMKDQIEPVTYKKWYRKYSEEKAKVESELLDLQRDKSQDWRRAKEALPHLLSLPTLYANATLTQKHALLNGVFKHGLTFSEDRVRTPSINPVFSHNILKIKQKGLVDIDQSAPFWDENSECTRGQYTTVKYW
ncbi:MAG: recombinase family protein [Cyclobacteriaceae bacterium]|nr:recombinase family protein [Cyclobacteriaceae bacterium]